MATTPRLFLLLLFFLLAAVVTAAQNVTCDARSLIADGERKLIVSGSIHHPHALSVFSLQHYLEERLDLLKFAKIVGDAGLHMILSIGPYVTTEWTYGLSVTSRTAPLRWMRQGPLIVKQFHRYYL